MSAKVHAFLVSYPHGGYRSFSTFETWNADLLAVEALGHRWILLGDFTAQIQVRA